MVNFKKGKLYKLEFLDHCVGIKEEMKCKVVGWVVSENNKSVTLSHWVVVTSCEETVRSNYEYTTILKSAIIKKREIR